MGGCHVIGMMYPAPVSCVTLDSLLGVCECTHALVQLFALARSSRSVESYCRVTLEAVLVVSGRWCFRRGSVLAFYFPACLSAT